MKTLEQLAREAGIDRSLAGHFVAEPEELARFRAACRAEALEEAAQLRKVVQAHVSDLQACIPTLRGFGLADTADEVKKACEELSAAIREMK